MIAILFSSPCKMPSTIKFEPEPRAIFATGSLSVNLDVTDSGASFTSLIWNNFDESDSFRPSATYPRV